MCVPHACTLARTHFSIFDIITQLSKSIFPFIRRKVRANIFFCNFANCIRVDVLDFFGVREKFLSNHHFYPVVITFGSRVCIYQHFFALLQFQRDFFCWSANIDLSFVCSFNSVRLILCHTESELRREIANATGISNFANTIFVVVGFWWSLVYNQIIRKIINVRKR